MLSFFLRTFALSFPIFLRAVALYKVAYILAQDELFQD